MTTSILQEKTHAGNPHVAPTPCFGAASRVGEGRTASAKPRRGALLRRGKSIGVMPCLAPGAALPAFGAPPTLVSPADDATLATLKGTENWRS